MKVSQSCPRLCNPMDCSPPGSSVHGILQARILEWVAIASTGELPNPGITPGSPAWQVDSLLSEPPGQPSWSDHLEQGSSRSRIWCLRTWGEADIIIKEIKSTVNAMHLNRLKTTPPHPSLKKLSSAKLVPGAKKVGDRWSRALLSHLVISSYMRLSKLQ